VRYYILLSIRIGVVLLFHFCWPAGWGLLRYVIYIVQDGAVFQSAVFKVYGQGLSKDRGGVFEALWEPSPG
jgi:hypothetical protein